MGLGIGFSSDDGDGRKTGVTTGAETGTAPKDSVGGGKFSFPVGKVVGAEVEKGIIVGTSVGGGKRATVGASVSWNPIVSPSFGLMLM
jgi:hypothetical protein